MSIRFGVVGDVHGHFDALNRAMAAHPDVPSWLSVGDVASEDLQYQEPLSPLYCIHGNNEDFDFIAAQSARAPGTARLHFLPDGTCTVVNGVAVAALGGTFAPTWYGTRAADLPFPGRPGAARVRDDKRRHFVREQVESLKAMRGVDVLLTHEAPRPFFVQAGPRRLDAGKTPVNEVLAAMRPRLHFFGHHHRFADFVTSGVRSIGLDLVSRSYVLVDRDTFDVVRIDQDAKPVDSSQRL